MNVSYSAFRQRLAGYMDEVARNRAPLTVTRQGGPSVVVVAEAEWEGLLETVHLLRSPSNARRLDEAIAALDAGIGVEADPTA